MSIASRADQPVLRPGGHLPAGWGLRIWRIGSATSPARHQADRVVSRLPRRQASDRRQRGKDDKGDDDDSRFYWEIEQEKYELGIDRDGFPILHPSCYETDAGADALYHQMIMERDD